MGNKHNREILHSSKSIEWYTPSDLLAEIEIFLGGIDLDPARPDLENGLGMIWHGRVFLNPPYGRHIGQWITKAMTDPVDELVLLVPASTGVKWFQPLWEHTICFITGRLRFSWRDAAPFNSVLVYRGPRSDAFKAAFSHRGHVVIGEQKERVVAYQLPLLVA